VRVAEEQPVRREAQLRRSFVTIFMVLAIGGTIGSLAYPVFYSYPHRFDAVKAAIADPGPVVSTPWGPLSSADRDLVVQVELDGLWEISAGRQAIDRAPTKAVEEAGDQLVAGHTDLDKRVRTVAGDLAIVLPTQPTAEQQGWLAQLTAAQDGEYRTLFANLLREEHGRIFQQLAQVRSSTRNTLVRDLATVANRTELGHISALERTGYVDFDAVARGATASPAAIPTVLPVPSSP
jgi:putative membrane protein